MCLGAITWLDSVTNLPLKVLQNYHNNHIGVFLFSYYSQMNDLLEYDLYSDAYDFSKEKKAIQYVSRS